MADYITDPYRMKSASGEAAQNVYNMQRDSNGRVWLWTSNPNAGDNIYVGSDDPEKRDEGFGGATLTFELARGGQIQLHGPWHSNSQALKAATGVDLTHSHATYVVIGMGRESVPGSYYQTKITDVIYSDDAWCVSEFDRGKKLAKEFANSLGKPVMLYQASSGGSSYGPVDPDAYCRKCEHTVDTYESKERGRIRTHCVECDNVLIC